VSKDLPRSAAAAQQVVPAAVLAFVDAVEADPAITATALGFALAEGRFSLDDTVVSHFPEFAAEITDPRSRSVTLGHVASMASGHARDMLQEALTRDPQEPVRGFLLVPPDASPAPCSPTASPAPTPWRLSSSG
jgi:CubicO group peptidase (beta-lactamase class C family)